TAISTAPIAGCGLVVEVPASPTIPANARARAVLPVRVAIRSAPPSTVMKPPATQVSRAPVVTAGGRDCGRVSESGMVRYRRRVASAMMCCRVRSALRAVAVSPTPGAVAVSPARAAGDAGNQDCADRAGAAGGHGASLVGVMPILTGRACSGE